MGTCLCRRLPTHWYSPCQPFLLLSQLVKIPTIQGMEEHGTPSLVTVHGSSSQSIGLSTVPWSKWCCYSVSIGPNTEDFGASFNRGRSIGEALTRWVLSVSEGPHLHSHFLILSHCPFSAKMSKNLQMVSFKWLDSLIKIIKENKNNL